MGRRTLHQTQDVHIDVTHAFIGDRPEPIHESIERFTNSCGEAARRAMEHIKDLLGLSREHGVPIFYTEGMDMRNEITRGLDFPQDELFRHEFEVCRCDRGR